VSLTQEDGWFAWKYGHRTPRKAVRFRHNNQAPAAYLTLLVPYRGTETPDVSATLPQGFQIGGDRMEFDIEVFGKAYRLGRELEKQKAWCPTIEKR